MKSVPLIRTSNLFPFINFLEQIGNPVERLLRSLHLHREHIFDLNAICTEYQMWSFLEKASRLEGINNLGMLVAQQSKIEDMGVLGNLLLQSITLKDCLENFIRFIGMHHSEGQKRFWLAYKQDEVFFCGKCPYRYPVPGSNHANGYSVNIMFKILKSYLGTQWQPSRIYLQDSKSKIGESNPLFVDVDLCYDHEYYAIVFPAHLLSTVKKNDQLIISQETITSWQSFKKPENVTQSLEIILRSQITSQVTKLNQIAEIIGISPRTINRMLRKENTTYRQILNKTRYQIAMQKIAHTSDSLAKIAFDLGYSDPAHFTRACKRWCDYTPGQIRMQVKFNSLDLSKNL